MALVTISSLLASTASYMISPILYNINSQLSYPMWIAFGVCCVGLISGLSAVSLTHYGERNNLVNVFFNLNNKNNPKKETRSSRG